MTPFLKTLLLWLLMAALPLQGMAAVVQSACSPSQHAGILSGSGMEKHHHNAGMTSHPHHDAAASPMPDEHDDAAMSANAEPSPHGKASHGVCSACALCCVGATAPPPLLDWQPGHPGSQFVLLAPAMLAVGHISAGIERPPKPIFFA